MHLLLCFELKLYVTESLFLTVLNTGTESFEEKVS